MHAPTGRHGEDGEPDLNALAAWVDGRLDAAQRDALAAHLATCPRCRAIVAELTRGTAAAASSWRPVLALAAMIAVAAAAGGAYVLVHDQAQPAVVPPPVMRPVTPAPSEPTPAPAPPATNPSVSSAPSASSPPSDRKRAAGTTAVHGKTFHLVAGEWIDDAYRENDFLPVVEISSRQQLDSNAALRRFASLGSRFTVVLDGTVYQVSLP